MASGRRDSNGDPTCSTTNPDAAHLSRLSLDAATAPPPYSPENISLLKPHRSSDSALEAIVSATTRRRSNAEDTSPGLSFSDFKLVRRIGSGDIGTVYLCRLREGAASEYAIKVVDRDAVALKNKTQRAETEKCILKMLDHPFLPTLYAEFNASNLSCIVMEYCPGGDLHSLRHRQPSKSFSLSSARFYAAEVLVALEYLHMLGIIYRDLKPENVLVRSDGHIMLSDFDLSLCSDSIPAVQLPIFSTSPDRAARSILSLTKNYPFTPFSCLPSPNRIFRSKKIETLTGERLFVAEPVSARSCSFVGTHEYIPPEVASGGSHGNAVDWWALGVFIYEMIYGRTPFAGPTNEATLRSILKKPLSFPTQTPSSASEAHARDLISGLLTKDPKNRVGSRRGAAEVKTHPFFKGLNFALVRSLAPPMVPGPRRHGGPAMAATSFKGRRKEATAFDMF